MWAWCRCVYERHDKWALIEKTKYKEVWQCDNCLDVITKVTIKQEAEVE